MKVAVIVLNYNKKKLLDSCLKSLDNLRYDNYSTIVVDNGSTDGSIELVKFFFTNVKLMELGENTGFCRGNNLGIEYAIKNGFEGIVVLNNDTEVDPDFLQEIAALVDIKKKIGMISTKIVLINKPDTMDAAGFIITPDGLGKNLGAGEKTEMFRQEKEVFCPTGAATFYCKELLEDIRQAEGGYYDEDFQYCYEELDLGWRARLRGWKCMYAPKSIIYHHKNATFESSYSDLAVYCSNRNVFFNMVKNYPSSFYLVRAFFLSFFRYILWTGGIIIGKGIGHKVSGKRGVLKTAKIFGLSFKDALLKSGKMLKKRKYIQNRKNVSKEEVARWFRELGLPFLESIYKL